ncbi:lipase 3 [Orussus abietinus]|uniref:lipase 3 n=1 Tax=Orussus abietinus TaxID=222816 RepID=UPI0006260CA8|nr:lipase 3 [Orussus abietinus]
MARALIVPRLLLVTMIVSIQTIHRGCIGGGMPTRSKKLGRFLSTRTSRQVPGSTGPGDAAETFVDMVKGAGYEAEEHNVTTEDGYVLSLHRIPGGPTSPVLPGKPAVILIHGLFGASDLWVLRGPGKDLAYLLADEQYDVWALNTRGNYYSRRHNNLSVNEPDFWRFSWHEFGAFDTAAVIDYVLFETGLKKVSLVGHSMGSTMEFVLLSTRPEYNERVNVVVSFAPVAIFTHLLPGLVNAIGMYYAKEIQDILGLLNVHEILPRNSVNVAYVRSVCDRPRTLRICKRLSCILFGLTNCEEFDASLIPHLLNHYPQGTSIQTLLHYRQIILAGKFKQYDFGPEMNYIRYKNEIPPEYPLEKVKAPVVLFYGQNDAFTTEKDVRAMQSKLPNASPRRVQVSSFGHLDFVFSKDSKLVLYNEVLEVLSEFDEERNGTRPRLKDPFKVST